MKTKKYKKGEFIFKEGEVRLSMYKVISGEVAIYTGYNTSNEILVTQLDSGKIFGEMEMLETFPRITTAIALKDDTELSVINYDEFGAIFRDNPDVILGVMNALSKRTMHVINEYKNVCKVIKELESEQNSNKKHDSDFMGNIKKYIDDYMKIQKISSLFEVENTPLF